MTDVPDMSGSAALAILESLLLALNDHDVLPEKEIVGVLRDAAAAHSGNPNKTATQVASATLIKGIIAGGNSVRRK